MNEKFPESGKFQLLSADENLNRLAARILQGELPSESDQILEAIAASDEAQALFSAKPSSQLIADAVNVHRQRRAVELLDEVSRNPDSSEHDLQVVLEKQWWMFGGRFIDVSKRRSLVILDQLDIPLIRSDGSLHIVELKRANIPKLISKYRNHLIVGDEVNEAVSQAMNYLVGLDEQRAQILADLKVDTRRASATVVIGHPDFVSDYDAEEIHETLRIYNSHLSRVEVITYDELVNGARQSFELSD